MSIRETESVSQRVRDEEREETRRSRVERSDARDGEREKQRNKERETGKARAAIPADPHEKSRNSTAASCIPLRFPTLPLSSCLLLL